MNISNSKKELARIISENGGWRDCAGWAAQHGTGRIAFTKGASKPFWEKDNAWWGGSMFFGGFSFRVLPQHHQSALSRAEYLHLYPAPGADGWIEWKGGECPVGGDVCVKFRSGAIQDAGISAHRFYWKHDGDISDIIAYRLHKPEQAKPEFCESVMRSIPEPEAKPTIEQLAADYRNAKDYAERKQQEADDAKGDADARLKALEIAGEAHGLLVTPITSKQEPELVITDWRNLQLGDIIEYADGDIKDKIGMTGSVVEFAPDANDGMHVRLRCDNGPNKGRLGWPRKWRFIRRP